MGSPVHLSKTLMNLVSNAAEALPNGGRTIVSTRNQYIDSTLRGYDEVAEGDYAVLTVLDNGVGIPLKISKKSSSRFIPKRSWDAVERAWVWRWCGGRSKITMAISM